MKIVYFILFGLGFQNLYSVWPWQSTDAVRAQVAQDRQACISLVLPEYIQLLKSVKNQAEFQRVLMQLKQDFRVVNYAANKKLQAQGAYNSDEMNGFVQEAVTPVDRALLLQFRRVIMEKADELCHKEGRKMHDRYPELVNTAVLGWMGLSLRDKR
jgi:hypothetical protein